MLRMQTKKTKDVWGVSRRFSDTLTVLLLFCIDFWLLRFVAGLLFTSHSRGSMLMSSIRLDNIVTKRPKVPSLEIQVLGGLRVVGVSSIYVGQL